MSPSTVPSHPPPPPQPKAGPSTSNPTAKPGKKNRQRDAHTQDRIKTNALKRKVQDEELRDLRRRVEEFNPTIPIERFDQLPLSTRTLRGLKSSHFTLPTPIQSLSIPPSLRGADVLGSARTGSGKTLAFLIPLLERLYMERWGPLDGLGAVVLSPTRELAIQTFNALRSIGGWHTFSAGLVIGGKSLKEEQARLTRMNILIATPGRLLQHFDSTIGLETGGVKFLVLDEADRLLDLGFLPTLKAIIGHITPYNPVGNKVDPATLSTSGSSSAPASGGRQTLLFSATHSPSLHTLSKLSLSNPIYINANVNASGEEVGEEVMPAGLEQYYAVVGLERKMDALWGFVKSHLKMKGVVFVSSCKQVRFLFETFRKLHPGLPLMHLHGKQKQPTRLDIFSRFSSATTSLLICTDIASRGLDFPSVDWVIQFDCPEDVDMYIHRVGRTARYKSGGKGLCLLLESEEEGMKKRWEGKGIEVKKIKIKESKMGDLKQQMQNFAFREPEIKYLGQRAFVSYLKSIHLQKDKEIFDLAALPVEAYAASLGLPGAPQIRFIDEASARGKKAKNALRLGQGADVGVEVGAGKGVKVNGAGEKETVTKMAEVGDESESDESEQESVSDESEKESVSDAEEEEAEEAEEEGESAVADARKEIDADSEEVGSEEDAKAATDEAKPKAAPAVRTKYDRMFERKNQGVLAPHYSALIHHDDIPPEDGDDDFLTLEKRDHTLNEIGLAGPSSPSNPNSNPASHLPTDLSKRKTKLGESKKAMLKTKGLGHKLLFSEDGTSREVYEMAKAEELDNVASEEKREEYVRANREEMRRADEEDRREAREKKREKKRKRKEREREMQAEGDSEDEGEFEVTLGRPVDFSDNDISDQEPVDREPARKKTKRVAARDDDNDANMEDEEALALRLLAGGA